jgi:hypothetical protein
LARASKTITRNALQQRLAAGNWRVTEWLYAKGKTYVQLVNTVNGKPQTRRVV